MPEIFPNLSNRTQALYISILIIVFSIVMTAKYFPGLENETVYSGNVYQTLHPDAFIRDPYRSPDRTLASKPSQISLFYTVVSMIGDIALDDRFLAVIYIGLVGLSLWGIDKTTHLLGISDVSARLLVLLMFLKDHAVLAHKVLFAHHQGFNHTVFAIPIIVWLFYAALARKGLILVLSLSVLLVVVSFRNAAFPIIMAMMVVAFTGRPVERIAVFVLVIFGLLTSYWILFHFAAVPDEWRLELWDILRINEGDDGNPFHNSNYHPLLFIVKTALWFAICLGAFFWSPKNEPAYQGVRVIMLLAVLIWLSGGIYFSYSPDIIKIPLLLGSAPTRALAWPQNLAYVVLLVLTIRFANRQGTAKSALIAGALISILYIIGPGNIDRWITLCTIACVTTLFSHWCIFSWRVNNQSIKAWFVLYPTKHWLRISLHTLFLVTIVAYSVAAWQKAPYWRVAFDSGVYGDTSSAAWIGVAEYIRDNTPTTAIVLPITYKTRPYYLAAYATNAELVARRSLGTRAGRSMPIPQPYPGNFRNPTAWKLLHQQKRVLNLITTALENREFSTTISSIDLLKPTPNYIILPMSILGNKPDVMIPYRLETQIHGYAILSR